MIFIRKNTLFLTSIILTSIASLAFFQSSLTGFTGVIHSHFLGHSTGCLPPAYLREIVNNPKEISESESIDAFDKLANNANIAIRSLKNGGFIYAKSENKSEIIKTLVTRGTATFLAYTSTTPATPEIQFTVLKNKKLKSKRCIVLRSNFMEDKVLTLNPDTNQVTFKEYEPKDRNQQWILKSGDGLNQVYFQNKATGAFLTIEGSEPCMSCVSIETPGTNELFKIVILDTVSYIE